MLSVVSLLSVLVCQAKRQLIIWRSHAAEDTVEMQEEETPRSKLDSSQPYLHLPPLDAPVIGVLYQDMYPDYAEFGNQYCFTSYVKWLEGGGARVVLVRGYQDDEYGTEEDLNKKGTDGT